MKRLFKKHELEEIKKEALKHIGTAEKDKGACVMKCGIYIFGGRSFMRHEEPFIKQNDITNYQGDDSTADIAKPIVDWLNQNYPGLEANFDYGILD